MASSSRVYRVADQIQRLVVDVIRRKVRDSRFQWVSITSVDVSKDLSYAKIYYTTLSKDYSKEELAEAFTRAKGLFRSHLAKNLTLRVVPDLRFLFDDSLEYGSEMSQLIEKARSQDQALSHKSDDSENAQSDSDDKKNLKKDKRKRLR